MGKLSSPSKLRNCIFLHPGRTRKRIRCVCACVRVLLAIKFMGVAKSDSGSPWRRAAGLRLCWRSRCCFGYGSPRRRSSIKLFRFWTSLMAAFIASEKQSRKISNRTAAPSSYLCQKSLLSVWAWLPWRHCMFSIWCAVMASQRFCKV